MSMSVKNRVAIFEVGKDDDKGASSKRPATPNSFKRPTTPQSPPFGQSFLKPTTPNKMSSYNTKELNSTNGRASWSWQAEESGIPAPDKHASTKTSDNRRFSSSYLPPSPSPVVLTQKSPMSKSSVVNIPFSSPQNTSKMQSTFSTSPLKKTLQSPPPKPVFPSQLSSMPSISSENKAPKGSEKATKNKALQLAKSRNSLTSYYKPNHVDVQRTVDDSRDDDVSSRNSDPELSSINGHMMTLDDKSHFSTNSVYGASDAPSIATATDSVTSGQSGQLSRAGKLSQAQRRSTTPDPLRSQSPMPAVRGAMTLSNVSHKEARKALLQAAQRKKDKADAIKQEEKEKEEKAIHGTEEQLADDLSKHSEGSVADRVATKAMNVLKMKNSVLFGDIKTKGSSDVVESHRDSEGSCSGSIASTSSRLKTHPAFAARAASPRFSSQITRSVQLMTGAAKTQVETKADGTPKAFSEELFSSFRHLHDLRPEQKKSTPNAATVMTIETGKASHNMEAGKASQGRPPQPSPMWNKSPRTLKEAMAAGKGILAQSFDNTSSPMTENNTGRYSIDSNETPFELEESLHSTTEHNLDRRWIDSTGQPKYAASQQAFRQLEGGFLSSLSGNTFSNVSMISSALDQGPLSVRVGGDGTTHPLGDITTPTMRSAHSMAQSIISTSPRVETSDKKGKEYENLLKTPIGDVQPHAEDFSDVVPSKTQEQVTALPSIGPSHEAPCEPTVDVSIELHPIENKATKDTIIPIQASYSAADAPDGFVFHDEDTEGSIEECLSGVRDPEGISFHERQNQNNETVTETGAKLAEKSTSTKESVSLRSGLSDVQRDQNVNLRSESPREGSKSIHSGLSALQNGSDLEGSTSIRSVSVNMKSTTLFENDQNEPSVDQMQILLKQPLVKTSQFDTIVEADDEEASAMKPLDEGLKTKPLLEDSKAESTGNQVQQHHPDTQSDHPKQILPMSLAVSAKPDKGDEDISIASSTASSQQSSKWRMSIPNLVKSVLAKASPRPHAGQTPRAQINEAPFSTSDDEDDDIFGGLEDELSKVMGGVTKKQQQTPSSMKSEVAAPPSTKNEAVAPSSVKSEVVAPPSVKSEGVAPLSMKSEVVVAKTSTTPRVPPTANRFFSSNHTRKSEPPPRTKSSTPQHRSSRTEVRTAIDEVKATPKTGLSLKSLRQRLTSPRNAGNRTPVNGQTTNDRSGTEVVEQEMEHVNSDITSSVLGGAPVQKKIPETPVKTEVEEDMFGKTPKSKTSKGKPPSTKAKTPKTPKIENRSIADMSGYSKGKDTLLDGTAFAEDQTLLDEATRATSAFQESTSEDNGEKPASMFMGLSCGLSDAFAVVSKVCHFGKDDDEEPETKTMDGMDDMETFISADGTNTSSSHLTELEKRVWNEWDKLDSAFNKANKSASISEKSKDSHEKKREVARGKLLEIANSAISSQMTKEGEQSAASVSDASGTTRESADTGNSSGVSGSSSEGQTLSSGEESHSYSYSSGSDMASELASELASPMASEKVKPATTPILLSFSQRSLIEKFSKQLTHHGVEVLKLNRRMQWQPRYFAVSKEQIALIAHEANTKSGSEVAQCPKALLWLKKFSSKNGGYSLSHIDKNGHGGMLLVDLKDIQVSADHQDLKTPLPKKLADKFKDSVMVALEYEFNGEKRRIEFRCKDNDEAQFLCTCMRVIRDLLKREQALRLKTLKKKMKAKK